MADTVKLSHVEVGQGTPLVLLHGFPLSGVIWHEQQQRLSERCRVIVPDLRGHGRSPAPSGVYEMELLARDVLALLDALGIPKAIIMGHSMGGYVTLASWRIAPERFLAMGLIASQAGADSEESRQGRDKMAESVANEGSKVMTRALLPKLFAPGLPAEAPIIEQVRQIMLNSSPVGIVGSLQGLAARPDSTTLLPSINVPVLIVAGEQDQIIAAEKARAMSTVMKTATLAMIANAGHMPMLEQPQATTAAIQSFVTQSPG